ncbi:MAG: Hsp20/alpha crystallin family protein [Cyclobacteriaceae bacterium]|nr:Hsp20/alpha crystallin family protein [Cyclobacteriaceae bacterium]
MRLGGLNITRELLLTADVMNMVNGGMSQPHIHMSREEKGYILHARVPGVEPVRMQIEIKNNQLFLFHHIYTRNENLYEGINFIPYHIGYITIPFDVNITGIKAHYEDGELKVIMPFNELSNGYHKRIYIENN